MEKTSEFLRAKRIGAALAYSTLLILSAVIIRQDHLTYMHGVREHVAQDVKEVAHRLEGKFFVLEVFADRLGAVAEISGDIPVELLERTAQKLLQQQPDIITVAIAPDLKVTHVEPLEGNESVLGLDYRQVPAQYASIAEAIRSGGPTLSEPVDLVQGGRGYILRHPVFASARDTKNGDLWGIVSIVMPEDKLLDPFVPDDPHGYAADLEIAIRSPSGGGRVLGSP